MRRIVSRQKAAKPTCFNSGFRMQAMETIGEIAVELAFRCGGVFAECIERVNPAVVGRGEARNVLASAAYWCISASRRHRLRRSSTRS